MKMAKKTYYGYTDAKKRNNARYVERFTFGRVRMTPERMEFIKNWIADGGAESFSSWVNDLITRALQDAGQQPPLE